MGLFSAWSQTETIKNLNLILQAAFSICIKAKKILLGLLFSVCSQARKFLLGLLFPVYSQDEKLKKIKPIIRLFQCLAKLKNWYATPGPFFSV